MQTSRVYDPLTSTDFMGYGGNRWVSPYTYIGLRNAMVKRFGEPGLAGLAARVRQEMLFLKFRLFRDGKVEMWPSFHLSSLERPVDDDPFSDISCELLDQNGDVLIFHRCRLRGPHQDSDSPHIVFHEAIPWVEKAASIRFLRNKEVLYTHEIENTPPEVKLRTPKLKYKDNATHLEWTARHPDKKLTYFVRYSTDGGSTWRVVGANLSATTCSVNIRLLSGGERCLLQVVATSGIRTAVVQSESFTVPLKPRTAYILSPEPKSEFPAGSEVLLRGAAFSPDFGLGEMEDAVWSSNLDGRLGSGFELVAEHLSSGYHRINLAAPDGLGGMAEASLSVRINRI